MENATLRSKQLSHKNQETVSSFIFCLFTQRWKYTECRQLDSHVERQIANVGHRFRHEENLLKFKSCPYSKDLPFENKSIMIADVVNEHNRAQSKQVCILLIFFLM